MGEYQMTNSYGLKTPEQWQQESILALLFHYDHVEDCFMADAIKVLPEDHDWNRAEEYLESLIEWLAGYTDESEVRKARTVRIPAVAESQLNLLLMWLRALQE